MAVASMNRMKHPPRAIHQQLSAISSRTIIIGLMLLTFPACGGPQERKAQYRATAQNYIQAGNFPKARVALRNVLKIDPKDAEAYFLIAQVEEKEKTGGTQSPIINRWWTSCRTTKTRWSR